MKIKDIIERFDSFAPLKLSFDAQKNAGAYDNSGLLIDSGSTDTDIVVCGLDLTDELVDIAIEKGAKLIITHHPVIYRAIKNISGLYTKVVKNDITVFSAHLNLDSTPFGIEDGLASICGAKNNAKINQMTNEENGFGRIFEIEEKSAESVVNGVIEALHTDKYMFFGDKNKAIKTVGTFCGAGLNESAANMAKDCDIYISADLQHHVILGLLENGKCVLQLGHYVSEARAMEMFVEKIFNKGEKVNYCFHYDKRFI